MFLVKLKYRFDIFHLELIILLFMSRVLYISIGCTIHLSLTYNPVSMLSTKRPRVSYFDLIKQEK